MKALLLSLLLSSPVLAETPAGRATDSVIGGLAGLHLSVLSTEMVKAIDRGHAAPAWVPYVVGFSVPVLSGLAYQITGFSSAGLHPIDPGAVTAYATGALVGIAVDYLCNHRATQ